MDSYGQTLEASSPGGLDLSREKRKKISQRSVFPASSIKLAIFACFVYVEVKFIRCLKMAAGLTICQLNIISYFQDQFFPLHQI